MSQDDIKEIEIALEDAQKEIELGRAVERLNANRDFKTVFLDGYFKDEAARLAMLYSHPGLRPDIQEAVQRDLCGPGAVVRYLQTILQAAQTASNVIAQGNEALDELRAEAPEGIIGGEI